MDAITIRDGDVLVLMTDQVMSTEEVADLAERFRARLDKLGLTKVETLVLTAGLRLAVLRAADQAGVSTDEKHLYVTAG